MKKTTLFLILSTLSLPYLEAGNRSLEKEQNLTMGKMSHFSSQLRECRLVVQQLTRNNDNVMRQFNSFSNELTKVYLSEEKSFSQEEERLFKAILFAANKHRLQTRKDAKQTPYIIHPLGVANYLITVGKMRDPDVIIGALLHDTVEDTETSFEEIEHHFGKRVALLVGEVTDDKSLEKQVRKQLQVLHAPKKSPGAAHIKLADKLYNLTDLSTSPPDDWTLERIDAYFQWAESVVNGLPSVNTPLKEAVDQVIRSYWEKRPL